MNGFEHLLRAHQMARWAPTDIHRRQSWWRKPKVGVERRHAPNIVDRGIAKDRCLFNSFVWDVVQLVLDRKQRRKNGDARRPVFAGSLRFQSISDAFAQRRPAFLLSCRQSLTSIVKSFGSNTSARRYMRTVLDGIVTEHQVPTRHTLVAEITYQTLRLQPPPCPVQRLAEPSESSRLARRSSSAASRRTRIPLARCPRLASSSNDHQSPGA